MKMSSKKILLISVLVIFCFVNIFGQTPEEKQFLAIINNLHKDSLFLNKKFSSSEEVMVFHISKGYFFEKDIQYCIVVLEVVNADIGIYIYRYNKAINEWILITKEKNFDTKIYNQIHIKDYNNDGVNDIIVERCYYNMCRDATYLIILYEKEKQKFHFIKEIQQLGDIELLIINPYFYTYYYCGCAGECWQSHLCVIEDFKLKILGKLGCNCYENEVIRIVNGIDETFIKEKDCNDKSYKYKNIADKWIYLIKEKNFLKE